MDPDERLGIGQNAPADRSACLHFVGEFIDSKDFYLNFV
jgi:hypothetical protein